MKIVLSKEREIVKILFKDFTREYNSRNISPEIGLTHSGAFRALKKLQEREIVKSKEVGKARIYTLNLDNPVTKTEIDAILTIEAGNHQRWIEEFKQLEEKVRFAVLFGSITKNEKEARDIDLFIVADKSKYKEIRDIINNKNAILLKKIHLIYQIPKDFKLELKRKNAVIIEMIKTGIVLFGQAEFRKMVAEK